MLRSLLVPLDGSGFSERSLPLAREVARATGASLHLAHVHVPYEPDQLLASTPFQYEGVDVSEYDEHHRKREEGYLDRLERQLREEGMSVDVRLLDGLPVADELTAYADETKTDMIFMTSHGYSGARRAWLGSVADEMIHRTTLPMLLVHPDENVGYETPLDVKHILVPLDGSTLAEAVLGPATELAKATGARLTLVHVIHAPTYLGSPIIPRFPESLGPEGVGLPAYLEGTADALREEGLEIAVHTERGTSLAKSIADIAAQLDADLIAIATHGYGGLKRAVLGSVADRLLHVTRLPLLLIRPAPEA